MTSSKGGTTPKYFYKNAVATPSGVDCKYMHATFFGVFPVESTEHYSWSQVCDGMRMGKDGWWDGEFPRCGH
ncbi:hypothetical protein DFR70_115122 [Nocardia tenerifensis]|uniref:Uncharacterized protein n=1 Tax=Nocardia tenerifensis TaxID=228006 RepID=A0A318JSR0_9NOCA|nr:hypothetical protein [Nocardia tenerifensis]PXX58149.1 hypothetical protein DFR70_115122 [Nocardia tenerifensis]